MEWIKVSKSLHTNIKVILISEKLGVDPESIAYKLIRVWSMADSECTVEKPYIAAPQGVFDRLFNCPGLAEAMAEVGWLIIHPDRLEFPKFDRHMGRSAKVRMLDSERKRQRRDIDGTESGQKPDKMRTKRGQKLDTTRTTTGQTPDTNRTNSGQSADNNRTECGQTPDQRRGEEIRGEETREEEKESSLRSDSLFAVPSPMTPPPSPVLLVFPVDGEEKNWPLTQFEVNRLQDLYSGLDVLAECKKAYGWITSSHVNRKTYDGMLRFLTNWLNKATNQTTARNSGYAPAKSSTSSVKPMSERIAEAKAARKALAGNLEIPLSVFAPVGLDAIDSHPASPVAGQLQERRNGHG